MLSFVGALYPESLSNAPHNLEVILSCDNSFFSHRAHPLLSADTPYSLDFLAALPAQDVPPVFSEKTGLGSSASLIVSLVAALFGAFGI